MALFKSRFVEINVLEGCPADQYTAPPPWAFGKETLDASNTAPNGTATPCDA